MSFFRNSAAAAALAALPGCAQDVGSDPNRYSVDASKIPAFTAAQPLSLKNAYSSEAKQPVRVGNHTLTFDLRQMTDTSIAMLQRALDKSGVKVVPESESEKAVMLRVRVTGLGGRGFGGMIARVVVDARLGVGTVLSMPGENRSPMGAERAFDGAILFALNRLLDNQRFIAYVERGVFFACLGKDAYAVGENVVIGERVFKIDRLDSTLGVCGNAARPTPLEIVLVQGDDRKEAFSYCAPASAQLGEKLMVGRNATLARSATVVRVAGPSPRCDDPQRNPTRVDMRFDHERSTKPAAPAAGQPAEPEQGDALF